MNSNICVECYFPNLKSLESAETNGNLVFKNLNLDLLYSELCAIAHLSAYAPSPAVLWSGIKALEQPTPHAFSVVLVARDVKIDVAPDVKNGVGKITGFLMSRVVFDELELDYIAVLPETRGQGVGIKLMQTLFDVAARTGVRRILLEVSEANKGARALYLHCGFAEVGRREKYYAGIEDALVLEKKL